MDRRHRGSATDAWKAWTGKDKQFMKQVAFADHLEDYAADVMDPDAARRLFTIQGVVAA